MFQMAKPWVLGVLLLQFVFSNSYASGDAGEVVQEELDIAPLDLPPADPVVPSLKGSSHSSTNTSSRSVTEVPIGSVPPQAVPGCEETTSPTQCVRLTLEHHLEQAKQELAKEIRTLCNGVGYDPMTQLSLPVFRGPAGLRLHIFNTTMSNLSNITLSDARINGSQLMAALSLRQLHLNGAINISGVLDFGPSAGDFYCTLHDLHISGTGSVTFRKGQAVVDNVVIGVNIGNVDLDIKNAGFIGDVFASYITMNQEKLKSRYLPPLKKRLALMVKASLTDIFSRSIIMQILFKQ